MTLCLHSVVGACSSWLVPVGARKNTFPVVMGMTLYKHWPFHAASPQYRVLPILGAALELTANWEVRLFYQRRTLIKGIYCSLRIARWGEACSALNLSRSSKLSALFLLLRVATFAFDLPEKKARPRINQQGSPSYEMYCLPDRFSPGEAWALRALLSAGCMRVFGQNQDTRFYMYLLHTYRLYGDFLVLKSIEVAEPGRQWFLCINSCVYVAGGWGRCGCVPKL